MNTFLLDGISMSKITRDLGFASCSGLRFGSTMLSFRPALRSPRREVIHAARRSGRDAQGEGG